jgi:3-oxoacyl-[acyl-carrier protein] reductase
MAALDLFDIAGKRAVVTGGGSGIGTMIASGFVDAGVSVIIASRKEGSLKEVADELSARGECTYVVADLSHEEGCRALGEAVADRWDSLDVLVNNAGANFARQPSEWDPAVFEDSVRLNLTGAFRMALAAKPLLAASALDGGASVLNVASMSAFFAVPVIPAYGAAKAGVVQMTKNLAVAWAPEHIRVNAVAPGLVSTRMTAGMKGVEAIEKPQLDRTAMKRWGTPEEIAPTFLYLASAAARFVTGATVCVDGGYTST